MPFEVGGGLPTGGRLAAHLFVAGKGDYYRLDDGLPQHQHGG